MGATDRQDAQTRYLDHFDDGGSGMRNYTKPIEIGDKIVDGGVT